MDSWAETMGLPRRRASTRSRRPDSVMIRQPFVTAGKGPSHTRLARDRFTAFPPCRHYADPPRQPEVGAAQWETSTPMTSLNERTLFITGGFPRHRQGHRPARGQGRRQRRGRGQDGHAPPQAAGHHPLGCRGNRGQCRRTGSALKLDVRDDDAVDAAMAKAANTSAASTSWSTTPARSPC